MEWVYVFNGQTGASGRLAFPAAVFSSRERAETWIAEHRLTGMLTRYPLDQGVYEWTPWSSTAFFSPKHEDQRTPTFIGTFSSAYTDHWHYEDGC